MTLQQHLRIPSKLREQSYDLFHYPHFDLPYFTPGKIVTTIHDLKYIAHPDFFPQFGSGKKILMWILMQNAVRKSRLVITDSESTKRDIVRCLRVKHEKVIVIPLGVELKFIVSDPISTTKELESKYGFKAPFVFYVGERRPHKNIENLIRAFHLFSSNAARKYQLIITGKSYSDYDNPERLVVQLGLSDLVKFIYVSDRDLPKMYQAADVFVTLSLYEGFGLPIIEAMASGTPVVASNTTSLPEVVDRAGVLVDPNNIQEAAAAIELVTYKGRYRESLIEAGLRRAKEFSWVKCAKQTLAVYQKAVSE
jgi:glycosyltransferase involved in cell wall biosynthesis